MKRKILLLMSFIVPVVFLNAQKYQFEYQEKEQKDLQNYQTRNHFLGEDIAVKMQLLRENYTYKVKDDIKGIETTEIEKPSIYYSVNKVNKYLKKGIKKGNISKKEAAETLDNMLNIAINIRYQKTLELEEELWSIKDPVEITALFSEGIALN